MIYMNISAVERCSRVNGPGRRAVIWVQGCTIGCTGCFNPHTHTHEARTLVDPSALIEDLAQEPGIEGISLSGGEPFEQAAGCVVVAERARAFGLSLVVFTGYPLHILQRSTAPEVEKLLSLTDLLVAGPYVRARPGDVQRWLGSSNQQLHFLTNRYNEASLESCREEPIIEARADGQTLRWSGFPADGDIEALEGLGCQATTSRT